MTFNPIIPDATQSPGLFPTQCQTNFQRLQTIVSANHEFNDTAAATDGYHNLIQILPTVVANITPNSAVGQTFVNSTDATNQLSHFDATGRIFQITPAIPTFAAVKFSVQNLNSFTILYSQNVTSVTQTVVGIYTINFTVPLPSSNYIVNGNVQSLAFNPGAVSSPDGAYGTVYGTSSAIIQTTVTGGVNNGDVINFPVVSVTFCGG